MFYILYLKAGEDFTCEDEFYDGIEWSITAANAVDVKLCDGEYQGKNKK